MNTPVSFSLAKLIKDKGYENDDCENVYLGDFDEEHPPEKIELSTRGLRQRTLGEFDYIAPSISDVIMWLYKNHKIWISCEPYDVGRFKYIIINGLNLSRKEITGFNSPTEAYEAAILYTLKNLI